MITKGLLNKLTPFMGGKKILFPLSLILSGVSSALNLAPFIFIWLIVREIFTNASSINIQTVGFYAWMALLSVFISMLIYFFALICSHLAAFRAEVGMKKVAMDKIMHMPLGYFDNQPSGKIRQSIDEGASATHSFLAHQLPDLAGSIVAPFLLLIFIFTVDWRLGLVSLIPIALGFISISTMMSKKGEKFRKLYMDLLENMSSEAVEYVRGIPVVKTFGGTVFAFKRFVKSIMQYKKMVYAYTLMLNKPMAFYTIIMQSVAFFLIPLALLLIGRGENLALALTDFIFYLLIAPNFSLVLMRSMYFKNYVSLTGQIISRFDTILDYPAMSFDEKGNKPQDTRLEFKNVSFAYDGADKNAISNISFIVPQGKRIALVGASGGGKTTIARLAARFWDVKEGEILIGNVNIKQIPKKDLMQTVSFVFQNSKLFKTSLKENIIFGKEHVSDEALLNAIELSQSKEIVDSIGLDAKIGSNGVYLSGGEQQRIALARAILKDSPIVLLDEATAFADPENEHLIQKALKKLGQGKTTLMIAHRLTSVVDADEILVIDEGEIVQRGVHEVLILEEGVYKNMWDEYQQSISWKI